jgi:hypothetical protein
MMKREKKTKRQESFGGEPRGFLFAQNKQLCRLCSFTVLDRYTNGIIRGLMFAAGVIIS